MRLISFSLFGGIERYNVGAIENAKLARDVYPGWTCRFYVDRHAAATVRLADMGCEIIPMPDYRMAAEAMCWRFLPASDPTLERAIFRDTDSRLNVREAAAVDAWIAGGQPFHIMRDHDHHRPFPVFGGMWGCVGGALPDMAAWIAQWPRWHSRMDDMNLLTQHAWPIMDGKVMHHSSVQSEWPSLPFPEHLPYEGFVGQAYP